MNLNIKIDVTKILKEHLFQGKNGAKYLDLVVWANKEGEDQYGNSHMVVQSIPKELRDAGQKGPILGNAKEFGGQSRPAPQQRPQGGKQATAPANDGWDDPADPLPF